LAKADEASTAELAATLPSYGDGREVQNSTTAAVQTCLRPLQDRRTRIPQPDRPIAHLRPDAAIRLQNAMSVSPSTQNPYDAKTVESTTPKISVTF